MASDKHAPFGVIWDMDGVLVDTGEFHYRSWVQALARHHIPFTREQFRSTFGMNNAGILQLLLGPAFTPELLMEIGEDKEWIFRDDIRGRAQALPGAVECLEQLKAMGARQAVASSAPQANVDALVDELGLRPYFHTLVSGAELPGKPDPATFLVAARRIGVPPEWCVVVEDAVVGVAGAKRAGMKCIAVTTTNPVSSLSEADLVVERLEALSPAVFKELLLPPNR